MVRLTDRPDMTLAVYRGRKTTTTQQQQEQQHTLCKRESEEIFMGHEFSCVVSSNICVFSRFIKVLNDHRCFIYY